MLQDYRLTSFEKGDFQDQRGNYWCTAAFAGVSEPVKWVSQDPLKVQVGQTYYGELRELVSKKGRPYLRFYRHQKPDGQQSLGDGQSPKKEWQPRDDNAIRAQWAISQAIQLGMTSNELERADIERRARMLFGMVERVKEDMKPAADKVFNVTADEVEKQISLDDIPF